MNNVSFYIFLASTNQESLKNNKVKLSGFCGFKFTQNKYEQSDVMEYQAFGETAIKLKNAGLNSVHFATGRLHIYQPDDKNSEYRVVFTIEQAMLISSAQLESSPIADSSNQNNSQSSQAKDNSVATQSTIKANNHTNSATTPNVAVATNPTQTKPNVAEFML